MQKGLLSRIKGLGGRGGRPAAPQTREKQKSWQWRWLAGRTFQRQGSQGTFGTPGSSIRLEDGRSAEVQEEQFIMKRSRKVPQNQPLKPVAGVMG